MPLYELRCQKCGHQFTVMVPVEEKDKVKCPACGSNDTKQVYSACSIAVRGGSCGSSSGWRGG